MRKLFLLGLIAMAALSIVLTSCTKEVEVIKEVEVV